MLLLAILLACLLHALLMLCTLMTCRTMELQCAYNRGLCVMVSV